MSTATSPIQNLMVIDSQVSNWQNLASAAGNDTAVLILDANLDGLTQISDYLSTFAKSDANTIPLQSIQIFSHGSAGSLLLGSTTLNANNLKNYTSQLTVLGNALTTTGDILLYGCNVASEQIGLDFINQLSTLTNADVAASTDLTGSTLLGGNWQLESTTGPIESVSVLNINTLNNYNGVLGNTAPIWDTIIDLNDGTEDTTYSLAAKDLLLGFIDNENDPLAILSLVADHGTVTSSKGIYSIAPVKNYNGEVVVNYVVSDGNLTTKATQSYTIDSINDLPTLKPKPTEVSLTGKEDTPFNIDAAIITKLLNNYVDVDLNKSLNHFIDLKNDKLSISSMDADHGTISEKSTSTGTTFIFTPDENYNGKVTLVYDIYDGTDILSGVKQALNISALNDVPVLSDSIETASLADGTINEPYLIKANDLLQGYMDIEGSKLSIASLKTDKHGAVKDNHDGTFTITPTKDYEGIVLLSYKIIDNKGGALKATLPFSLINNAPKLITPSAIKYNDTISDDSFKTITRTLVANDLNDDALIYGIKDSIDNQDGSFSKNSSFGKLTINSFTGEYNFTPNDLAIEALTKTPPKTDFTITVSDGVVTKYSILNINIISNAKSDSIKDDILVGTDGNDKFDGLAGSDKIIGKKGNDILNGGAGADTLDGGYGSDTYYVDNKGDKLIEFTGAGIDTVYSTINYILKPNFENLTLLGAHNLKGTGNFLGNILTGNTGKNILNGNQGNDILNGGLADDVLTGGPGNDKFQLTNFSKDTIKDFSVKDDTIQLENNIFTSLGQSGPLNADNFIIGDAATDANDYVIYNKTTGILSYDADGNEPGSAIQIALISGHPALTIADFHVI